MKTITYWECRVGYGINAIHLATFSSRIAADEFANSEEGNIHGEPHVITYKYRVYDTSEAAIMDRKKFREDIENIEKLDDGCFGL